MTYPPGSEGGFDARAFWRFQRDRWHRLPESTRMLVRLGIQAVIVVALLIGGWWGFAVLLAIFFALSWLPDRIELRGRLLPLRRVVVPAAGLVVAIVFPFVRDHIASLPLVGPWPQMDTAVIMTVYAM